MGSGKRVTKSGAAGAEGLPSRRALEPLAGRPQSASWLEVSSPALSDSGLSSELAFGQSHRGLELVCLGRTVTGAGPDLEELKGDFEAEYKKLASRDTRFQIMGAGGGFLVLTWFAPVAGPSAYLANGSKQASSC